MSIEIKSINKSRTATWVELSDGSWWTEEMFTERVGMTDRVRGIAREVADRVAEVRAALAAPQTWHWLPKASLGTIYVDPSAACAIGDQIAVLADAYSAAEKARDVATAGLAAAQIFELREGAWRDAVETVPRPAATRFQRGVDRDP